MAVAQRNALARDRRHGGSSALVHHAEAQPVGNEQDDIVRMRLRCLCKGPSKVDEYQDYRSDDARPTHRNASV
jgi:hypothetical protein